MIEVSEQFYFMATSSVEIIKELPNHIINWNIFENIWSGALAVFLGYPFFLIRFKKKLHNFFGFTKNKKITIYLSSLFVSPRNAVCAPLKIVTTFSGNVISFNGTVLPDYEFKLIPRFSSLFNLITTGDNFISALINKWIIGDVDIYYKSSPNSLREIDFDQNIITIGSPGANSVSEYYLNTLKQTKLYFTGNGTQISLRGPRKNRILSGNTNTDDFAILERTVDRYTGKKVIICAGLGYQGTSSAAHYLIFNWYSLAKKYGDNNFALCLRIENVTTIQDSYKYPKIIFEKKY